MPTRVFADKRCKLPDGIILLGPKAMSASLTLLVLRWQAAEIIVSSGANNAPTQGIDVTRRRKEVAKCTSEGSEIIVIAYFE